MPYGIQDICYLDTVNPPVATYNVLHGSWDHTPEVPIVFERSVTGKLHTHRVVDGVGDPYQFEQDKCTIRVSLTEMLTLRGLIGRQVYFIPNYHNDGDITDNMVTGYLSINSGGIVNIDPIGIYWNVTFQIMDDSTV